MTSLAYAAPVLLVGAGPAALDDFEFAHAFAKSVVAVDGGYDALGRWGKTPDSVLGDMDSIRADVSNDIISLPIPEQDTTDLEKALRVVDAPLYLGIGFLDGRLDHTLAAMHALVSASQRNAIMIGSEDVVFATPNDWQIILPIGTRISFYPVQQVTGISSTGLRWPLDGLVMEGGKQIGVSNEVTNAQVKTQFSGRGSVTILPRQHLPNVIDSLTCK